MQLTSLKLKKPEQTDPVDIQDLNDNADIIDTELKKRPEKTGSASDMTVAFTEPQTLGELSSGDTLKGLFGKLKLAVKNVISIVKLLGTTDISAIGGGTVTGAISALNSNLADAQNVKLQLSGGDDVLSDQIYANWSQVPIGYGCIRVGNGSTVRSGTYIKYSDAIGSINLNRADGGTGEVWSIINGTYNLTQNCWIDLTPQCTFYVTLQPATAFASWIKYNPSTRELKGVIETTSDIKNQQRIVDFPAQLPGLGGINTFVGVCGVAVNGMNNTDPYLRIMPRVQGGEIISSHTREEIVHGATYMISFIAQC